MIDLYTANWARKTESPRLTPTLIEGATVAGIIAADKARIAREEAAKQTPVRKRVVDRKAEARQLAEAVKVTKALLETSKGLEQQLLAIRELQADQAAELAALNAEYRDDRIRRWENRGRQGPRPV